MGNDGDLAEMMAFARQLCRVCQGEGPSGMTDEPHLISLSLRLITPIVPLTQEKGSRAFQIDVQITDYTNDTFL